MFLKFSSPNPIFSPFDLVIQRINVTKLSLNPACILENAHFKQLMTTASNDHNGTPLANFSVE